jgi:hypothetical protein
MVKPKIYADFHNADAHGRLRLDCIGTVEDLAEQHVELHEGLLLTLYADDLDDKGQLDELLVNGVVSSAKDERCWVAAIDWNAIRHASDGQVSHVQGNGPPSSSPAAESGRGDPSPQSH